MIVRAAICCITGPDVGGHCLVVVSLEYSENADAEVGNVLLGVDECIIGVNAEH